MSAEAIGLKRVGNDRLDDVRVYNRALSADEVRALYQAGASSR